MPPENLKLLSMVFFNNTGVKSLDVFEHIPGIKKIYCDNTKVDPDKALKFMLKHPDVDLVFESDALANHGRPQNPKTPKPQNPVI